MQDGIDDTDEADTTWDELPEIRFRTITEKGKLFRLSTLKERIEKINVWLHRKCSTTEDLLSTRTW